MPLNPYSTENLNLFIKHREPFRKFAAPVPAELASQYFEVGPNARYLATVGRVKPDHRGQFAAAILAGDLLRVHTVDRDEIRLPSQKPIFQAVEDLVPVTVAGILVHRILPTVTGSDVFQHLVERRRFGVSACWWREP